MLAPSALLARRCVARPPSRLPAAGRPAAAGALDALGVARRGRGAVAVGADAARAPGGRAAAARGAGAVVPARAAPTRCCSAARCSTCWRARRASARRSPRAAPGRTARSRRSAARRRHTEEAWRSHLARLCGKRRELRLGRAARGRPHRRSPGAFAPTVHRAPVALLYSSGRDRRQGPPQRAADAPDPAELTGRDTTSGRTPPRRRPRRSGPRCRRPARPPAPDPRRRALAERGRDGERRRRRGSRARLGARGRDEDVARAGGEEVGHVEAAGAAHQRRDALLEQQALRAARPRPGCAPWRRGTSGPSA